MCQIYYHVKHNETQSGANKGRLIMFVRGIVKILTAEDKSDFILLIQCLLFSEIITNVITFL